MYKMYAHPPSNNQSSYLLENTTQSQSDDYYDNIFILSTQAVYVRLTIFYTIPTTTCLEINNRMVVPTHSHPMVHYTSWNPTVR